MLQTRYSSDVPEKLVVAQAYRSSQFMPAGRTSSGMAITAAELRDSAKLLAGILHALKEKAHQPKPGCILLEAHRAFTHCQLTEDTVECLVKEACQCGFSLSDRATSNFCIAVSRQFCKLQSWFVYNINRILDVGPVLVGIEKALASWILSTCRCFFLPQKVCLQPLLLAKRWGRHFEAAPLPPPVWCLILRFLHAPRTNWHSTSLETFRHAEPGLGHMLFLPALSAGRIVSGSLLFVTSTYTRHSRLCEDLLFYGLKLHGNSASTQDLWQCLSSLADVAPHDTCPLKHMRLEVAVLIACIVTRLLSAAPVFLADFQGQADEVLAAVEILLRARGKALEAHPVESVNSQLDGQFWQEAANDNGNSVAVLVFRAMTLNPLHFLTSLSRDLREAVLVC